MVSRPRPFTSLQLSRYNCLALTWSKDRRQRRQIYFGVFKTGFFCKGLLSRGIITRWRVKAGYRRMDRASKQVPDRPENWAQPAARHWTSEASRRSREAHSGVERRDSELACMFRPLEKGERKRVWTRKGSVLGCSVEAPLLFSPGYLFSSSLSLSLMIFLMQLIWVDNGVCKQAFLSSTPRLTNLLSPRSDPVNREPYRTPLLPLSVRRRRLSSPETRITLIAYSFPQICTVLSLPRFRPPVDEFSFNSMPVVPQR